MAARHEHFMPVALLDSQFATLQEPTPDEHPITVDVGGRPTEIVGEIVRQLEARQGSARGHESASEVTAVAGHVGKTSDDDIRAHGNYETDCRCAVDLVGGFRPSRG